MPLYDLLIDWIVPRDTDRRYVADGGRAVNERGVTLPHALVLIEGEINQVQHANRSYQITLTSVQKE